MMEPADLPAVREAVMTHGSAYWPTIYAQAVARGEQGAYPAHMDATTAGQHLSQREVNRLMVAELFHVSEAMTYLASAAAASMPAFTLRRDDLPSDYGLIVFADPVGVNDGIADAKGSVYIVAASWGLWGDAPRERAPHGAVWVTWYTDRDRNFAEAVRIGRLSRAEVAAMRAKHPPLVLENESQVPFGDDDLTDGADESNPYVQAVKILRTTWTLMQQKNLSAEREIRPTRGARRRLTNPTPDLMKVRVITLRSTTNTDDSEEHSSREYRHRWIVRGHWRQQWYATREVHRPVWIAPHVKGPDDAPLLGGEKVYAWRR